MRTRNTRLLKTAARSVAEAVEAARSASESLGRVLALIEAGHLDAPLATTHRLKEAHARFEAVARR